MPKFHGKQVYDKFDNLITAKILEIADIESSAAMYDHVHILRSLRNILGGGMTPLVGASHFQTNQKRQARITIWKFFEKYVRERRDELLLQFWGTDLTKRSIRPKREFVVGDNTTRTELYLQGHIQGNIPIDEIIQETIPGSPMDWAGEGRTPAEQAVFDEGVEQVILHTNALNIMRRNAQEGYKVLAAQALSQSVPYSGNFLLRLPSRGNKIHDRHFLRMLRLRLGIPQVPMSDQILPQCNNNKNITTASEPLYAIVVQANKGKKRHDKLVKVLAQKLNNINGVTATFKPEPDLSTTTKKTQLRGDIKVEMNGKVTMVDIMITGPATSFKVKTHETHLYPGRAAQLGFTGKKSKWRNADIEETEFKLLPFVIETGGRIHKAACQWLDAIAKGGDMGTCLAVKQVYKAIARQLNFMQADMLHQYHRRDRPITRIGNWFLKIILE